jgi:hypothetical protein
MAKKKITNVELTALFIERLEQFLECPEGIMIAIVPSDTDGSAWEVATNAIQRKRYPLCMSRIEAIETQLRRVYVLVED